MSLEHRTMLMTKLTDRSLAAAVQTSTGTASGERMAQRLWSQHQAGGVRQRVAARLAFALGGTIDSEISASYWQCQLHMEN